MHLSNSNRTILQFPCAELLDRHWCGDIDVFRARSDAFEFKRRSSSALCDRVSVNRTSGYEDNMLAWRHRKWRCRSERRGYRWRQRRPNVRRRAPSADNPSHQNRKWNYRIRSTSPARCGYWIRRRDHAAGVLYLSAGHILCFRAGLYVRVGDDKILQRP